MGIILEMKGISKRFPGVKALDNVSLSVAKGEIHSLIGQNGAGKSTLMKILAGNYGFDDGHIEIEGKKVSINSTQDAKKLGISIVYQELSLLPNLSVANNIFLGRELGKGIIINEKLIINESKKILLQLGIQNIDVNSKVELLPLAQQQLIEIAKALSSKPKLLVLDEPTAALTNEDTEKLFNILDKLKSQGLAIVFITHRLKEIIRYCDRGTILINGKVVSTLNIKDVTEDEIIKLMLGGELERFYRDHSEKRNISTECILRLENFSIEDKVKCANFEIHPGEIVGITGLLGAGQNEIVRALFGVQEGVSGKIYFKGKQVKISSPYDATEIGIGLLTENRKEEGLFLEMSVLDNITIASLKNFKFSRIIPLIKQRMIYKVAQKFSDKVNIIMPSLETAIRNLSGGNQQKAIISRWLLRDLEILVFIEPTRGVDVGAKAEIYRYLDKLAREGKSIIVVSTDTTEVLGVSDRILVMYKGEITAMLDKNETEEVLLSEVQGRGVKVE